MNPARTIDPAFLRSVFSSFPTGVTVLGAVVDGAPVGLTANSFVSVALEPALVSVCIAQTSTTWPELSKAPRIGISILAEHQGLIARRLANRSPGRFDDVPWVANDTNCIAIVDCVAWLETQVVQTVAAGDHEIVIMRVIDLEHRSAAAPLVFHGSTFKQINTDGSNCPLGQA